MFFPHVQKRVQEFLHPGNGIGADYQPHTALEAFGNGGLWAAAPARAASRTCCPTRMPTSSSPSPARSSA